MLLNIRRALRLLRERLARLDWEPPTDDPEAPVREPNPHRPGGRRSAVAELEPTPPSFVRAVGRR
jgi:hypothetical protein